MSNASTVSYKHSVTKGVSDASAVSTAAFKTSAASLTNEGNKGKRMCAARSSSASF